MGSKRRSSDIISLLVSIYGSKDIFIDEYRGVLADRLLQQLNYNTARYDQRRSRLQVKTEVWNFCLERPRDVAPVRVFQGDS